MNQFIVYDEILVWDLLKECSALVDPNMSNLQHATSTIEGTPSYIWNRVHVPTGKDTSQRRRRLNPNEDFVVDLTTHVQNNFGKVEHLDVLAITYAKHLTKYWQALVDCDYIGECIVLVHFGMQWTSLWLQLTMR